MGPPVDTGGLSLSVRPSKGCQIGRHWSPAPSLVSCAGTPSAPKAIVQPGVATPTTAPQLTGSKPSPPGPRSSRRQAHKPSAASPEQHGSP
ncbi:hypothetical protein NDU88_008202 [Pleurodeles waltl]|uniref:Uncharacterized protein n=1 Tax=Pleurodeles waltl TaxID=8319 RepID=A0AAV7PNG6_PLEWA|nr:hypothetical protein NDU88_008202 [Pleurodeles waltl]